MSLFKRKKKNNEEDTLLIQLSVEEKDKIKPVASYVLTPDEIEGDDNPYTETINININ